MKLSIIVKSNNDNKAKRTIPQPKPFPSSLLEVQEMKYMGPISPAIDLHWLTLAQDSARGKQDAWAKGESASA